MDFMAAPPYAVAASGKFNQSVKTTAGATAKAVAETGNADDVERWKSDRSDDDADSYCAGQLSMRRHANKGCMKKRSPYEMQQGDQHENHS